MILKLGVVLLLAYTCAGEGEESKTCSNYALPDTFIPESYDLKLYLHDPTAKTYKGKVTITGTTKTVAAKYADDETKFDTIVLNAKDLTFDEKSVTVNNQKPVSVTPSPECQTVAIKLTTPLAENTQAEIVIMFEANLRTDMYGLYKSTYTTTTSTDATVENTIIASQFQPTHARSAFPCFDEPSMKATFDLQVDVPEGYEKVLSNQPAKGQADCPMPFAGRGLKRVCFKTTPKMSTYLLALVVSKFEEKDVTGNSNMKLYSRLPAELAQAASVSSAILKKLEEQTGKNYDNGGTQKLDQVAIPDFSAGAMENWGLVTYRESALLYNKDSSTTRNKQRTSQIIAHEFSHMWFGNMLTTAKWDTTWLNEGFARYFEYFGLTDVKTGDKAVLEDVNNQFIVEQVQSALAADDVADASYLNEAAKSPEEIKAKFSTISYNKGASIIRMLENHLGKDTDKNSIFLQKLNGYLTKNIPKEITTPEELWEAFHVDKNGDVEGNKVNDIFPKWASQPGYPVVSVSLGEENKLTFKQEPFTYTKDLDKTKAALKWTIPITFWSYTTQFEEDKVIFEESKDTAEGKAKENAKFVVVNPGQTGYYRVKYEGELLDTLAEALQNGTIKDDITRAQIVDDAFNLARAGHITYGQAMSVVSFLAGEVSYYPWHAAFRGYSYLRRRVTDETLGGHIVRQMKELSAAVNNETLKTKANPSDIETYRKVLVQQWMCELNVEECVEAAKASFNKQIAETEAKDVPVDERSYVYCSAIRHSDKENWQKLWDRYEKTSNANEKVTILTALGCSTDKDVLNDYLQMSLGDKIRSQDANTVFNAVLTGNPVGVSLAVDFLKTYHEKIKNKYGGLNALNNMVLSVADRIVTDEDTTALNTILDDKDIVADMELTDKIVQAAKDTLSTNKAWIESNQDSLKTYYKGLYGGAASMTAAAGLLVLVVLNFFL